MNNQHHLLNGGADTNKIIRIRKQHFTTSEVDNTGTQTKIKIYNLTKIWFLNFNCRNLFYKCSNGTSTVQNQARILKKIHGLFNFLFITLTIACIRIRQNNFDLDGSATCLCTGTLYEYHRSMKSINQSNVKPSCRELHLVQGILLSLGSAGRRGDLLGPSRPVNFRSAQGGNYKKTRKNQSIKPRFIQRGSIIALYGWLFFEQGPEQGDIGRYQYAK